MEIIMKRALLLSAALALLAFPITTISLAKDAAKEGGMCDGIIGIPCEKGLFCEHPAGECGGADRSGKCEKKPEICPKNADPKDFAPVCACGGKEYPDGRQYPNDCERKAAGAQKDHDGPCDGEKAK
jgi:hypothetical protein